LPTCPVVVPLALEVMEKGLGSCSDTRKELLLLSRAEEQHHNFLRENGPQARGVAPNVRSGAGPHSRPCPRCRVHQIGQLPLSLNLRIAAAPRRLRFHSMLTWPTRCAEGRQYAGLQIPHRAKRLPQARRRQEYSRRRLSNHRPPRTDPHTHGDPDKLQTKGAPRRATDDRAYSPATAAARRPAAEIRVAIALSVSSVRNPG
jgi:hypothetical protein